jgi:uncharacterized protein (DUF488 family)
MAEPFVFTIGHSNHPPETLVDLLKKHDIQVVVDTRSSPYSRYVPHFNKEELEQTVCRAGLKYLFMGGELGGRPQGDEFYDEKGHVLYYRVAEAPFFLAGIERLENGIRQYRVALLCSEEDPATCHRQLLISRVLAEHGVKVQHIRGDGTVQDDSQQANGKQLLLFDLPEENPWRSLRPILRKEQPPEAMDPSEEAESDDGALSD